MKPMLSEPFRNFKTISPQGDGNLERHAVHRQNERFQNHIPARGRKLEEFHITNILHLEISKPYPRKGTETLFSQVENL